MHTYDAFGGLLRSDNAVVQMFIDACRNMGITPKIQIDGKNVTIATQLMTGPAADAALGLLRDEGFDVALTNGVLQCAKYAIVLSYK